VAKILLVDDADFMRFRTAKLLAENGYETIEAKNGEEAVAQYFSQQPDMVLMDITMPILDGIAALQAIRARDPQAKVVMCSALGQQSAVLGAIKAGAKDFIVKPFQADKILATVQKFVG
jgi:two-component system chemotaxis response regulator CheY